MVGNTVNILIHISLKKEKFNDFSILTGMQCYSLWPSFHEFSRQHEFFWQTLLFSSVNIYLMTLCQTQSPGPSFNVVTPSLAILCVTWNLWLVSSCLYPSLVSHRPSTTVFGTIQATINLNQVSGTIIFYHKTLSLQYHCFHCIMCVLLLSCQPSYKFLLIRMQIYHSFTVEYVLISSICQFNLVFKYFLFNAVLLTEVHPFTHVLKVCIE